MCYFGPRGQAKSRTDSPEKKHLNTVKDPEVVQVVSAIRLCDSDALDELRKSGVSYAPGPMYGKISDAVLMMVGSPPR